MYKLLRRLAHWIRHRADVDLSERLEIHLAMRQAQLEESEPRVALRCG